MCRPGLVSISSQGGERDCSAINLISWRAGGRDGASVPTGDNMDLIGIILYRGGTGDPGDIFLNILGKHKQPQHRVGFIL